jgi:transcriptional regulator GlxA family with amidase domain
MNPVEARRAGGEGVRPVAFGFLLADHFTLAPLALFVDALRLAADEGDRSRPIRTRWSLMAPGRPVVRASCGLEVRPEPPADPATFDYLVVAGGLLHAGPQVGPATVAYLERAAGLGKTLVGICTGSFVLARAGLMRGRTSCVSWYHHQDFTTEFPDHSAIADRLFLVDRDRITSSGGSGAADLAAFLIERHLGRATAQKSLHVLQLERAREAQSSQPHPPLKPANEDQAIGDERVRKALLVMEEHLATPVPIETVATTVALSTRQLERRFKAALGLRPAAAYRRLRLRYAQWLLDHTTRSLTEIAVEAGFADAAHFSRAFKTAYGSTPSTERRRRATLATSTGPCLRARALPAHVDRRLFD